jgi:hypothetical protein
MEHLADAGVRAMIDMGLVVGTPKSGTKRFWTTVEIAKLKEHYPKGGLAAAIGALPGRSASTIYSKARSLKLSAPSTKRPYQRYQHSAAIDAVIKRGYASAPEKGRGAIRELAASVMRPVHYVTQRARTLGCVAPRFKEPKWTKEEEAFVEARAHLSPATIKLAMKRAKLHPRSETAIIVKLKRLGASTEDPNHYTASGFAKLMGVDRSAPVNWIKNGLLKASHRGTARTEANGGDMWWIRKKDARDFLIENVGAYDIRKVEKFWFVDLLTNRT